MVERGAEEELQRLQAELNTIYRIAPMALASLTADLEFRRGIDAPTILIPEMTVAAA